MQYNAGDLDAVMDLYAEDAVQNMPDGTFVGEDLYYDNVSVLAQLGLVPEGRARATPAVGGRRDAAVTAART